MDTEISIEIGKIWAEVSAVKTDIAVIKHQLEDGKEWQKMCYDKLTKLHGRMDTVAAQKDADQQKAMDRKNKLWIAVIGAISAGIASGVEFIFGMHR